MKVVSKITVAALALALLGCQSTGVVPIGQGSYLIAKKDGTPGLGVSFATKAAVYQEANDFCKAKGQTVKTDRIETTPAQVGRLGGTELQFSCV